MSILLDTNICIAVLKGGDPHLIKSIQSKDPNEFFLCSIVKAELLYGARKSQKVEENLSLLKTFFSQFDCLPFDDHAAGFYGITRAILEKDGKMIGANDLMIASITLAYNLVLATRNCEDFKRIPGLRLEIW